MRKIKQIVYWLTPPDQWKCPVIIVLGIFVALATFVFHLSKAPSYLSDQPQTCVNCHVMGPQYASWYHSSHREVASCNDCHVPHNNILNHYYFKAKDGMRHSYMFTFRLEPQVIRIHQAGKDVVQDNCIRCHTEQIHDIKLQTMRPHFTAKIDNAYCIECHRDVPHGTVSSLSSIRDAHIPVPASPVPEWLRSLTK
ncbi:cytochrome c nitrite reductase small subunit [Marinilabiliaceae bacterium ANBcel2]|nr:cytochrome c nitrite reductase small subunit [Marinilabiliaceae bacterium ANBcel2]